MATLDDIPIEGTALTCAQIRAVAQDRAPAALTGPARERIARSAEFAERIARERPLYGRSTGVGANLRASVGDAQAHARALLRSHAISAGAPRDATRVRAMLVVRLNQLAAGGSGVSLPVAEALERMLAADALPDVRELGSLGTADLAALAVTALTLLGERAASQPFTATVPLGVHDALPLISSNAAVIGDAALACGRFDALSRAGAVVAALTLIAVDGNLEAFAPAVERVTPFAGARAVCGWMRVLATGDWAPARLQDPFGLRTLPQVQGVLVDAIAHLVEVSELMANAPSENPVVLADEAPSGPAPSGPAPSGPAPSGPATSGHPRSGVAHHGGFQTGYLAAALDGVRAAAARAGELSVARLGLLSEPGYTGQPAFLGDGTPGASGVMMLEYVAADALGELRALAGPVDGQTAALSRGVETGASFSALAARQALIAVDRLTTLVACELVAAVRALLMRELLGRPSAALDVAKALLPALIEAAAELQDRDLSADLALAERLLPRLAVALPAA